MDQGEQNLKTGKEKEKTQEEEYREEVKKKIKTVEFTYWKYLPTGNGHEYSPSPPSYLQDLPSVFQDPMWNNFPHSKPNSCNAPGITIVEVRDLNTTVLIITCYVIIIYACVCLSVYICHIHELASWSFFWGYLHQTVSHSLFFLKILNSHDSLSLLR